MKILENMDQYQDNRPHKQNDIVLPNIKTKVIQKS